MQIPNDEAEKAKFLEWIVDICTSSQWERRKLYERRRRYYLFGQNSEQMTRLNRMESHLGLVASFLFSPDGLQYTISAPPNSGDKEIEQYLALQDDWNEEVQDSGLADSASEAVIWSLVYDTMILKLGWDDNTGQLFPHMIEPSSFGVFREDQSAFSMQQAMTHSYVLDFDDAVDRLIRAGQKDRIKDLMTTNSPEDMGLPSPLTALIISSSGPGGFNPSANMMGEANMNYEASPSYTPKISQPMVRFHEVWVWDSESNDYRIFEMIEPDIIISDSKRTIQALKNAGKKNDVSYASDTNFFLKGENPFVPITAFPLYNYFWGQAHSEAIIPLQDWSSERLAQINDILNVQADPSKVFSGFMGMTDEKALALSGPGGYVSDQMPGAKVDVLAPQMPEDLFSEFNKIGDLMMEASGLTEILAGKGSGGARGGKQSKQLQITGGGRIRKIALGLEKSWVRLADIGIKLKMKNDEEELKTEGGGVFVPAQLDDKMTIRVAGHGQSPLYKSDTQEQALLLFKTQCIDQEGLVRALNPPAKDEIIHSLKKRQKAAAEQHQAELAAGIDPHHKKGK
jgi:hypothetical protein